MDVKEYFLNEIKYLVSVKVASSYSLILGYSNTKNGSADERRSLNINYLLKKGTVFEPLIDKEIFKQVQIIDGALSWKINGKIIDICPDDCYMRSTPIK